MKITQISLIVLVLLSIESVRSIDPPKWPETFSQEFVLSYPENHHTTGKLFYSAKTNQERYDIQDARFDMFCSSVSHRTETPCSIIITKGNLYLNYPAQQKCCRCCSEQSGCVITKRDAFEEFEYIGEQDLSGESFYKWGYQNREFYYARKDPKFTPRRIDESEVKITDFLMNTYSEDSIAENVFALPSYCRGDCPRTTICGQIEPETEKRSTLQKEQ